jgi:hypothetical protein
MRFSREGAKTLRNRFMQTPKTDYLTGARSHGESQNLDSLAKAPRREVNLYRAGRACRQTQRLDSLTEPQGHGEQHFDSKAFPVPLCLRERTGFGVRFSSRGRGGSQVQMRFSREGAKTPRNAFQIVTISFAASRLCERNGVWSFGFPCDSASLRGDEVWARLFAAGSPLLPVSPGLIVAVLGIPAYGGQLFQ